MPAIFNPSFWDYLAQAGSQGITSYGQSKDSAEQSAARKRAEALQALQFTMNLENQGMVPFTQVNDQIKSNEAALPWLKNVQMNAPSAGGLNAQISNTPDRNIAIPVPNTAGGFGATQVKQSGMDQFTDAQRARANLPTRDQVQKSRLDLTKANLDIKGGVFNLERGQHDAAYADSMEPVKRLTELQPVLKNAAERYVAKQINLSGGRLDPKKLDALAQNGFVDFAADKTNTQLLQMQPDQQVLARSYFDEAVRDAFVGQMDRDLRKQIAAIQASGRDGNSLPAMINALSGVGSKLEVTAKNMEAKLPPGTLAVQGYAPETLTETQKSMLANIEAIRQQSQMFTRAAAGVGSGVVTPIQAQQLLAQYAAGSQDTPGNAPAQTSQAPGVVPPGSIPSMGGKRKITADQREYLKARGQWDPSKYEVVQ